jgi:hypothetical protein
VPLIPILLEHHRVCLARIRTGAALMPRLICWPFRMDADASCTCLIFFNDSSDEKLYFTRCFDQIDSVML